MRLEASVPGCVHAYMYVPLHEEMSGAYVFTSIYANAHIDIYVPESLSILTSIYIYIRILRVHRVYTSGSSSSWLLPLILGKLASKLYVY